MITTSCELATAADAAAIAALRLAVARDLTAKFGRGPWSFAAESEAGVRIDVVSSQVLVWRQGAILAATVRLSHRQPWIGQMDFFTACARPWYLTSMAVTPKLQRCGVGRACLADVRRYALDHGADALRLDAYDAPAGAGDFYRKNGYTEVRRQPYNGTPLIFFEQLLQD